MGFCVLSFLHHRLLLILRYPHLPNQKGTTEVGPILTVIANSRVFRRSTVRQPHSSAISAALAAALPRSVTLWISSTSQRTEETLAATSFRPRQRTLLRQPPQSCSLRFLPATSQLLRAIQVRQSWRTTRMRNSISTTIMLAWVAFLLVPCTNVTAATCPETTRTVTRTKGIHLFTLLCRLAPPPLAQA